MIAEKLWHIDVIRRTGNQIEMIERSEKARRQVQILLDADFISVQGDKALVAQLGMRDQYFVISKAYRAVPQRKISILDLLGSHFPVRKIGMTMKIRFVKLPAFRNQFKIHPFSLRTIF